VAFFASVKPTTFLLSQPSFKRLLLAYTKYAYFRLISTLYTGKEPYGSTSLCLLADLFQNLFIFWNNVLNCNENELF